jgi:UDP-N-acetylglucosamine--N-acetylmuramyl-(pentapeptide) pyrophosphoryl-undecaprenol N-acetylglucosamine transferase
VISIAKLASPDWAKARKEAKTRIAKKFSVPADQPLVFIFGGSQGSLAINQVIGTALDSLADREISIIHGVGGKNELPAKRSFYTPLHYIEDMADLYLAADLIIARSGAVTCAEFQALGRFALFIPLPVGNGEQALNAAGLVNAGRAEIVAQKDFTPSWLTSHFDELLHKSGGTPLEGDLKSLNSADMICELIESAVGDR